MTENEEKISGVAINAISKTEGYKAILALIDENCEACELIGTDIRNADFHGVLAFANGCVDVMKRLKMQIENLANLNFSEEGSIEP